MAITGQAELNICGTNAPSKYHSIDNPMIKFKGGSVLKQYMSQKPLKHAIRSGFKWTPVGMPINSKFILAVRGTLCLSKGLGNALVSKQHHIFFDNFFTSVSLLIELLQKGIYATELSQLTGDPCHS